MAVYGAEERQVEGGVPDVPNGAIEEDSRGPASANGHGLRILSRVIVDTYNEELRDEEGFVGDRASGRAFSAILDDWRERLASTLDEDPFGDTPTGSISKTTLDKLLTGNDTVAAGLVHTAVEEFAHELATVVRRFLRLEGWCGTERIVIGGGLSSSQIGQLAMGRAQILLAGEGTTLELFPISSHPDEAGLIGAVELATDPVVAEHDTIVAADIGGTNLRVGIVRIGRSGGVSKGAVWKMEHWCHRDDDPTRDQAVRRLVEMTTKLVERAVAANLDLAPFMGIGCPGLIDEQGAILNGGQNLPGNWQEDGFNLVAALSDSLPRVGGRKPLVALHNDAVVQGLSEVGGMTDVERWGVLTIGTGLGNARFTNRSAK